MNEFLVKEGKRTSPQKGSTNGVHATQTPAEIPTYLMNEQAMHLMNFSSSHTVRWKFSTKKQIAARDKSASEHQMCFLHLCACGTKSIGRLLKIIVDLLGYLVAFFYMLLLSIQRSFGQVYLLLIELLILVSKNLPICTYVCWIYDLLKP
jgi:hypothetical protein